MVNIKPWLGAANHYGSYHYIQEQYIIVDIENFYGWSPFTSCLPNQCGGWLRLRMVTTYLPSLQGSLWMDGPALA